MKTTCPKCQAEITLEAFADMPEKQLLYLEMKSESELFSAKTIGKAIIAAADLQVSVAKEIGFGAHVFIDSIKLESKRIKIGFLIARMK